MASRALLFSVLAVMMSGLFPLKSGGTQSEDSARGTMKAAEDEGAIGFSLPRNLAPFFTRRRFAYDIAYHIFLNEVKLFPDNFVPQHPKGRQYRRKVDNEKAPETSEAKFLGNSKLSPQYDNLVQKLFRQKFKMKTNESTTTTKHKLNSLPVHFGTFPDRTQKILSILAVFGEHFTTDRMQAHTAAETPSETITVTTPSSLINTNDMSCIHVEGYDQHQWVHVVNFCASDWRNKTEMYLCRGASINDYVMTDTPVQDSEGVVYANRFCAFCHYVHVSRIRKWQIAWICERNDNPAASLMQPEPFADLMAVVTSLRTGNTCKMIRTPAIKEAIQGCSSPVLRGGQLMPLVNAHNHVPTGTGYPVSLNILMNFDFSGKTHIMFEDLYAEESIETKLCPQGNFVWDAELGRCREVVCAKGFHFGDTYTTCLKDDSSATIKEDEVLTDLSQLAQSNDIERVTLEVEVPSVYAALITLTSNDFWKEQIAQQLNISSTRIQQFNVSVENATGEASTLLIQKLSNKDFPAKDSSGEEDAHEMKPRQGTNVLKDPVKIMQTKLTGDVDRDFYTSSESPRPSTPSDSKDENNPNYVTLVTNESLIRRRKGASEQEQQDKAESSKTSEQIPALGTTTSGADHELSEEDEPENNPAMAATVAATVAAAEAADATAAAEAAAAEAATAAPPSGLNLLDLVTTEIETSASSEVDPAPRDGEGATLNNFKVIMTFILLPPESFANGNQRSGHVVEALSSLVSSNEFRFIINGTSLQVANMAQEDKVKVFSPTCPYGVLLVLDGEQIELDTNDSPHSANISILKDLRTGKRYVQGMFDVSFIVSQPINNTTQKAESYVYNALACEMPRIIDSHCRRIRLGKEEYTIHPNTKALTFQNSSFDVSSYEFMGDKHDEVEICMPDIYKGAMAMQPSRVQRYYYLTKNCATDYQDWMKAEGYLTAVLGRISIGALCAVLLTYFLFPKLRNLPGVNIMSLTFALFLAEVIFAAGEEVQIPWLCTAVAASLHYCFLSSHCWMNVMSYDVYRTFAASTCILTRVRDKRKMFPRYALYAWGMPLLVVGACLFVDLSHIFSGIKIGYGGTWSPGFNDTGFGNWSSEESGYDAVTTTATTTSATTKGHYLGGDTSGNAEDDVKMTNSSSSSEEASSFVGPGHSFSCWIQKPLAALFAFGAPILLIFLMNCIFFTRTIASIRTTSRLARHSGVGRTNSSNSARQMSGHNDVILYVKMSSVMGFTWVFGLASSIISSLAQEPTDVICYTLHVLGVLFPILNSSQGLFIFFAFVFNRRVLGQYRGLLGKVKKYLLKQREGLATSAGTRPFANIATIAKE